MAELTQAFKLKTKGGIEVENISINDIHWEFEYGHFVKVKVLTVPNRKINGTWEWQSEVIQSDAVKVGTIINYSVSEGFAHYGPNLYDYEAYIINPADR